MKKFTARTTRKLHLETDTVRRLQDPQLDAVTGGRPVGPRSNYISCNCSVSESQCG